MPTIRQRTSPSLCFSEKQESFLFSKTNPALCAPASPPLHGLPKVLHSFPPPFLCPQFFRPLTSSPQLHVFLAAPVLTHTRVSFGLVFLAESQEGSSISLHRSASQKGVCAHGLNLTPLSCPLSDGPGDTGTDCSGCNCLIKHI